MKISDIKQKAKLFFAPQDETLAIDALLVFLLKKEPSFLIAYPEFQVPDKQFEIFWSMVEKLKEGVPLAYLTNEKEFYGLSFYTDKNVLVPRPESELIIDLVKELVQKKDLKPHFKVLDVGTGSGNLIVTLLKNFPEALGEAIDISLEALKVAQLNADRHKVSTRFRLFQSNLLTEISAEFDLIIANLPYIGTERFNFVAKNVADFEPSVALYGGNDGLELYRKMFQQLKSFSWRPQFFLGEFGFGQAELMQQELQKFFPEARFEILKDYALIDRIFMVDFRR